MQSSDGRLGHSKHRKMGTPGHNRDVHEVVREMNKVSDEEARRRTRKRTTVFSSIADLMRHR